MPLKGVGPEHIRENSVGPDHLTDDSVGPDQLQDGTVELSHLAAEVLAFLIPTGTIVAYGGTVAPTGWLMTDGTAVSRTTEAALFAVYGTAFGAGDGTTTFNLPNLNSGKFPLGKASAGTGSTLGGTGGTIDHVHALNTATSHAKSVVQNNGVDILRKTVAAFNATHRQPAGVGQVAGTAGLTLGTELGGNSDTANPPFQVVNFICKR